MVFVVMLEGDSQIAYGCWGIGFGHEVHIVALDGLHNALCHAIALRFANVAVFVQRDDARAY